MVLAIYSLLCGRTGIGRDLPLSLIPQYLWEKLYQIVSGANVIIANSSSATPAQIAEARFFRAWAYDQLVTGWGDVPLLTEPVTTPRTDFTRTPKAEVDKVIDEDLQFAMENLPEVNALVKEARISKDAARILAGQAYNRMGYQYGDSQYYSKAEQACTAVINSGNYKLISERYGKFTLEAGDFYADMFRYGNQRRSQGNTEVIWNSNRKIMPLFQTERSIMLSIDVIGFPRSISFPECRMLIQSAVVATDVCVSATM